MEKQRQVKSRSLRMTARTATATAKATARTNTGILRFALGWRDFGDGGGKGRRRSLRDDSQKSKGKTRLDRALGGSGDLRSPTHEDEAVMNGAPGKRRSRFPEGMTERKARAEARAEANAGISPLRCAPVEMTTAVGETRARCGFRWRVRYGIPLEGGVWVSSRRLCRSGGGGPGRLRVRLWWGLRLLVRCRPRRLRIFRRTRRRGGWCSRGL